VESGSRISLQLEWFDCLGTILREGNDNNYRQKQQIIMVNKISYWLKKQLNSPNLKRQTKCWPLSKKDGKMFRIFERRILRMIYSPVKTEENGEQDTIMNLYVLWWTNIVKVVKIGRLKWMGQLVRMQEMDPCRKLALLEPEGTWHVGKPKLREVAWVSWGRTKEGRLET
jgi:hypothetical protein